MFYNFDEITDRKNTNAIKTDALKPRFGSENLIPLWVADMDFKAPPQITEAIMQRAAHGIYGYTFASESYYEAIINWVKKLYNWDVAAEEISYVPGIVKGIAFAIDCFTQTGDKIIIQPPVYHPFHLVPTAFEREVVSNPLCYDGTHYHMDFEQLERLAKDDACKMLILSNPHNPGGMVWDKETLQRLAYICSANNVLVLADEIHAEIVHQGFKHIPFARISSLAADNSITFMAPSKTFNLAGIVSSYTIIKNKELRNKYFNFLKRAELNQGSLFAYLVTEVAYTQCSDWRLQMIDYISNNIQYVTKFLQENIPAIKAMPPQASYLVWLDCKGLGLDQKQLNDLFIKKACLALNDGEMFGTGGTGFMRLNVGCPLSVIQKAMLQLKAAVES